MQHETWYYTRVSRVELAQLIGSKLFTLSGTENGGTPCVCERMGLAMATQWPHRAVPLSPLAICIGWYSWSYPITYTITIHGCALV